MNQFLSLKTPIDHMFCSTSGPGQLGKQVRDQKVTILLCSTVPPLSKHTARSFNLIAIPTGRWLSCWAVDFRYVKLRGIRLRACIWPHECKPQLAAMIWILDILSGQLSLLRRVPGSFISTTHRVWYVSKCLRVTVFVFICTAVVTGDCESNNIIWRMPRNAFIENSSVNCGRVVEFTGDWR
jgi:hypothetical protein